MNVAYLYVAGTVLFSVYGQLVVKWQVDSAGGLPPDSGRVRYFIDLALNPWMISAFVFVGLAALCWIAALDRLELSRAYPFVASTFILILVASAVFFDEPITALKVLGALLIVAGVVIGSQG